MKLVALVLIGFIAAFQGCKSEPETGVITDPNSPERSAQEQQACVRRGGSWTASGDIQRCITPTGEGLKRCETGRDCKGECLARSMTCAPFVPLTGCQETISDGGLRATLCLD